MKKEKEKSVRFNFYGIEVPDAVKEDFDANVVDIITGDKETYKPIASGDYRVKLLGQYSSSGDIILGAMSKTKVSDLPFKHNYDTDTMENLKFGTSEGLGVPSHFLIDKKLNVLMLQSGVIGANQWSKFMEVNYGVQIETPYIIDPKSWESIHKINFIKRILIKVKHIKEIQQFTKYNSVINVTDIAEKTGSDYLSFSLGSNNGMNLGGTRKLLQAFYDLNEENKESIIVEGKDENQDATDVFDLVTNRYFDKILIPKSKNLSDIPLKTVYDLMEDRYKKIRPLFERQFQWKK